MALLRDLMDADRLAEMIRDGFVSVGKHPDGDLHILNYTHRAAYSRTWNDVTRQCRGLIVDRPITNAGAEVVARPFPKFFNVSEHDDPSIESLPDWPFVVYPKMDGSLGILYTDPQGLPAIATRGSFTSDQALWATNWYREQYGYKLVPAGYTQLFEIIYPTNRIVVDYGGREELYPLAIIDNETGADRLEGIPAPLDGHGDLSAILQLVADSPEEYANQEGFVLRFIPPDENQPSVRAKAKFSDYVRLHRIITGVSARTIWEYLSTGRQVNELVEHVPDEFYDWVESTATNLWTQFHAIRDHARRIFELRPPEADRKTLALMWQGASCRAILFKMLDNKPYDPLIWKMIKPAADKPFREDIDG